MHTASFDEGTGPALQAGDDFVDFFTGLSSR